MFAAGGGAGGGGRAGEGGGGPRGGVGRVFFAFAAGRAAFGEARAEKALAGHRGVLSLVFPELAATLTEDERAAREDASGVRQARYPTVALRLRPMVRAWIGAIASLFDGAGVHV